MITKDTVEHIARLAAIEVPSERLELLTKRFSKVLEYVSQLNEVDTTAVEPTSHALDITQPMREDRAAEFDAASGILSQAPAGEAGFFKVPKVI